MVSVEVLVFLCTAIIPPGSGIQTSLTQSDRMTTVFIVLHFIILGF